MISMLAFRRLDFVWSAVRFNYRQLDDFVQVMTVDLRFVMAAHRVLGIFP